MSPTSFYGSMLAMGMAAVVAALLYWQRVERRSRPADLSNDDHAHFKSQDVRRGVVLGILTLLAVGISIGSRMPYQRNGRPSLVFIETWLAIFALVLILVGLALADWWATRNYALRHRSEIVREGINILRDEMRLRIAQSQEGRRSEDPENPRSG